MAKKVTWVPQKNPKNPPKIEKMAKNSPTEPHVIALKRVKNALKMSKKGVKKGSKMIQKMGPNQAWQ